MDLYDVLVGFFYSMIFLGLGYFISDKMSSPQTKKYFLPALALKLIGGISVGLIYYYYYEGGDTVTYYTFGAQKIFLAFMEDPSIAFQMIFGENVKTPENYPYATEIWVFSDDASYYCVRFAGFLNLFAFNTYAGTVLIFAFLSFLCVWSIYQFLVDLYPDLHKQFAISFLFLPSVFFWGSGILKDTLTFAFLCLMIKASLEIFYYRRKLVWNVVLILVSGYFIAQIKIYILIALMPATAFLFFYGPIKNINNPILRVLFTPFMVALSVGLGYLGMQQIGETSSRYNLDTMAKTAEETARWIHYVSVQSDGSAYSLGDYDFSGVGMLKKTIPAIWVSLFRPHPWEAKNPVMALSALEAVFFLWLFMKGYFKNMRLNGKARGVSILIPYCLIYSLIFAWAVGMTSYNFGSLVRYKIPMMPFFAVAMFLIERNKKLLIKNGH